MDFTLVFIEIFGAVLFYAAPILILLVLLIVLVGLVVGKKEGWRAGDAIYYAFITALTVGYGDFHPKKAVSKYLAVTIAVTGLILTGLVVAVGVHAGSIAFKAVYSDQRVIEKLDNIVNHGRSG
jgi:voltage-gated potassium channel